MADHPPEFLHALDDCGVCRVHNYGVSDARNAMLRELTDALGEPVVARPWSPSREWTRALGLVRNRGS